MEELVTCEGTVHSVIFQNAENGYTVLRLLTEEGEVITVVGCIPCVAPGEHLAVSGTWEPHPQHGEQLRAVELERSLPEDEEEIFSYLSSGVCKGVGPATARRIVDRFGPDTLDILEREPERLTALKGITAKKAQEIAESFRRHMGLRRLMAFLAQYELPPILAMELRRQYGDAALEKVRENPYLLSGESCGVAFSVTDRMAMGMGLSAESEQRLQAAVTFELLPQREQRPCVPAPEQADRRHRPAAGLWERSGGAGPGRPDRPGGGGPGAGGQRGRLLPPAAVGGGAVRLPAAGGPAGGGGRTRAAWRTGPWTRSRPRQGITYAPQQRQAVELAARRGVLILTGGPGTGKTTTVRGIVALFRKMGLEIVLAAPTGRAAKRMSELTGMEAQTVHRLLGMSWSDAARQVTFQKTEKEPLEADAVIVDEMSMVDLTLFSALLRALRPGTRLVLVGDADQLPSVGAGNVFSDLIRSGRVETVFLREVFRQAEQSAIIRNAHAVNLGQPPSADQRPGGLLLPLPPGRRAGPLHGGGAVPDPAAGPHGHPGGPDPGALPHPEGPQRHGEPEPLPPGGAEPAGPGQAGDPVGGAGVPHRGPDHADPNDYDVVWERTDGTAGTGMFNGDVGRIMEIDPSGELLAVSFDDRMAVYTLEMLGEIDLAYAHDGPQGPGQRVPVRGPGGHAGGASP